MAPFAPGLFSTTPGCPRYSWNFDAMARPTMSEEPPGTKGMMTLIGLAGNVCAPSGKHTAIKSAATNDFISDLDGKGASLLRSCGKVRYRRRTIPMRLLVGALSFAVAAAAQAQTYPNKPIRVVVPYAAGGTSDILARQLGPKINEVWGQPVVVENKPGANGMWAPIS